MLSLQQQLLFQFGFCTHGKIHMYITLAYQYHIEKETLNLHTHKHIPYQHILARNGQWTQCVWVFAKIDSWYKNPKLART